MCGIHLLWGKEAKEENIHILLEAGRHRGPDQEASLSPWPGIWIGVNRLRISDPSPAADQPFWTSDQHAFLIWNGELYNSKELKSLLTTMGYTFVTDSDTEVLLVWLRSFGEKGMARLKGMFSFILVDVVNKSILTARDPSGEKPLYFKQDVDTLCISSTASGIARVFGIPVAPRSFPNYAFLRAPRHGHSFFNGIKSWRPGQFSSIQNHLSFRFDSLPETQSAEEDFTLETFEEKLTHAVTRQIQADVPAGMLLSGGADSSLLYAIWHKETGERLPAFTLEVEPKYQGKYQDAKYSKAFAEQFPCDLMSVPISQETFLSEWDEYLPSIDQPVGDSAGFLLWFLGKKAKEKGIKVLISGAGADELWGGYRRHSAFQTYLAYKDWLLWAKPLMQSLPLPREYSKFFKSIRSSENHTFLNFSGLRPVSKEVYEYVDRFFDKYLPPYKRALDFDRKVYLVEDVLKIQDQSLMAHGIEGRSPYLDSDLVDFWRKVENLDLLTGKKWIHELLNQHGLGEISNRPKLGFGLPLREWFLEGGPVAKRAFSVVKKFGQTHQKDLGNEIFQITQTPEKFIKSDFLMLYNLFLLAEWVNLRYA